MATEITIKEITPLDTNTVVTVAQGLNLLQYFHELADTPNSYTGQAGKYARVNSAATGLEFADADATTFAGKAQSNFVFGDNDSATTFINASSPNDINKSGFYYLSTHADMPRGGEHYLIHESHPTLRNNYSKQTATHITTGRTFSRLQINNVWQSWEEVIVGVNNTMLMTEGEARAIQAQNEITYSASGMVHSGKAANNNSSRIPINEGMWTLVESGGSDRVMLGRTTSAVGASKTDFPVTHIAGAVANIMNIDESFEIQSSFRLPQAEDGTRIYDSTGDARGSGSASLDLKVDVDPKYGNVPTGTPAQILREGVGRAFEGLVKNGDFREDTSEWGSWTSVANGLATKTASSATNSQAYSSLITVEANTEYEVSFVFESTSTTYGIVYASTTNSSSGGLGNSGNMNPSVPEQTGLKTFTFNTGSNTQVRIVPYVLGVFGAGNAIYSQFSIRKVTEQVVTHPVDLLMWEYYEEETDDEIFECIQSLSTTFGDTDVPTVLSTRPKSYFQQYDGQVSDPDAQNDTYRCVRWSTLTDEQKRKVAGYMGEKLFMGENGRPVNGRLRARTIRGLGNGDWVNVDSNTTDTSNLALRIADNINLVVHGSLDSIPTYYGDWSIGGGNFVATGFNDPDISHLQHKGVFTADKSGQPTNAAYKGRCFAYVVATVPRANRGGYHPNLNPYGTAKWNAWDGTNNNPQFWYQHDNFKTTADCFNLVGGGQVGVVGGAIVNGNSWAGHPDGIFYDGITAGGLNGVIDWRLPAIANDTPEEQSKVQGKVENKTYRGLEKLVRTHVQTASQGATSGSTSAFDGLDTSLISVGDTAYLENYSGTYEKVTVTQSFSNGTISFSPSISGRRADSKSVFTTETNLSTSGEVNTSMVIGDPANLVQVDALKGGWLGTWCPVIPVVGQTTIAPLSRKHISNNSGRLTYDIDNNTWTGGLSLGSYLDPWNELRVDIRQDTQVQVVPYTAYAKVTKPSSNKAVYNGKAGLMPVFVGSHSDTFRGCTFQESLIGKVGKNNVSANAGKHTANLAIEDIYFDLSEGKISGATFGKPEHAPITLTVPNNNSPAVKVLPYQISNNGQCSIGYQANELTYEAVSPVQLDTSTGGAITENVVYFCNGGYLNGHLIRALNTHALINLHLYCVSANGDIIDTTTGSISTSIVVENSNYRWGDDSKIKVTASGSGTFTDLNGNTNLQVVHELAIPSGWTRNVARVGEQTEGVDLLKKEMQLDFGKIPDAEIQPVNEPADEPVF